MATQLQIISALWIMLLKCTANQNSAAIVSKPTYSRNFINTPVTVMFHNKLYKIFSANLTETTLVQTYSTYSWYFNHR